MKIKYKNSSDCNHESSIMDYIKKVIHDSSSLSCGSLETTNDRLDALTDMVASLIEILADKNIISLNEVRELSLDTNKLIDASNEIKYVLGDATQPKHNDDDDIIIAHICNDIGKFGAGFSGALLKRFPRIDKYYFEYVKENDEIGGTNQYTIYFKTHIVNMISQKGVRSKSNPRPIRYDWLEKCLEDLARYTKSKLEEGKKISIHMPRIGIGLSGGSWDKISKIINEKLIDEGLSVTVYDLEDNDE